MEIVAGAALLLLGLYFIPWGRIRSDRPAGGAGSRLPPWADRVINLGIAILCLVFGMALLFGRGHLLTF